MLHFGDHELHWVQKWVRFIIEGSETHVLEDSEEKEERGEVEIGYDSRETPIYETNWEGIKNLLDIVHEVDDDRLPYPI